ncbi:MAG: alpha/beta hydrolase [Nocardiopsaceae bacterium]|nr:alpha/beta hydrolase [Nocardiopsaceae bacterium]
MFVHGLVTDNLSSFYYTLAGPVVAAGARALLYDLRGHGKSERTPRGYTTAGGADDLCALLDALDVTEPVYLVGNSYGGLVAARTAVTAPGRVAGLALIEANCAGSGAEAWLEAMLNTLTVAALGLEYQQTGQRLRDAGRRKLARMAMAADALLNGTSIIDDLSAERPLDPGELARISCPVLGVYGQESELADGARDLAARVPACRIEIMPGLAHTVLREAAGPLRDLVLGWLPAPSGASSPVSSPAGASSPGGVSAPGPVGPSPDGASSPASSPTGISSAASSSGGASSAACSPGGSSSPGGAPGEAA